MSSFGILRPRPGARPNEWAWKDVAALDSIVRDPSEYLGVNSRTRGQVPRLSLLWEVHDPMNLYRGTGNAGGGAHLDLASQRSILARMAAGQGPGEVMAHAQKLAQTMESRLAGYHNQVMAAIESAGMDKGKGRANSAQILRNAFGGQLPSLFRDIGASDLHAADEHSRLALAADGVAGTVFRGLQIDTANARPQGSASLFASAVEHLFQVPLTATGFQGMRDKARRDEIQQDATWPGVQDLPTGSGMTPWAHSQMDSVLETIRSERSVGPLQAPTLTGSASPLAEAPATAPAQAGGDLAARVGAFLGTATPDGGGAQ